MKPKTLMLIRTVGFALATLMVVVVFGAWLNEQFVKPLVVAWLWIVFYVTHLPQWAVWAAALTVLALVGGRLVLPKKPFSSTRAPSSPPLRPTRGPVNRWAHTLELALQGPLYRRKLLGRLEALRGEAPHQSSAIQTLRDRFSGQGSARRGLNAAEARAYLEAVAHCLDEAR